MGCHGPQRTAGEMRMIVKSTQEDLVKAHATLKQKMEERMLAEQRRDDMFSKESMKFFGNLASNGLNFSNLGELRSLKVSPPPLVQLVTRCVCTLIMGDDIGQAEANELAEMKRRAHLRRVGTGSNTVRGAHTVQSRLDAARAKLDAVRQSSRAKLDAERAKALFLNIPQVSHASPRRTRGNELISWKESLTILARTDFKWRLMNLNGKSLLNNTELVDVVRSYLDLSSIQPSHRYTILPGRSHPGDRDEAKRARRELVSALYNAFAEAGIASGNKLQFEEARYTSEVAGAMLIWIRRVFEQHEQLQHAWEDATMVIAKAHAEVLPARLRVDELRESLEELLEEQKTAEEKSRKQLTKSVGVAQQRSRQIRTRVITEDSPYRPSSVQYL